MTDFRQLYDDLPAAIKEAVTYKEFMWMGHEQRAELEQQFTSPEYDVEDNP